MSKFPNELYAIQIKTSEGWKLGPRMNGLDIPMDVPAPYFMSKINAEELTRNLKERGIKPENLRLIRFKFDGYVKEKDIKYKNLKSKFTTVL